MPKTKTTIIPISLPKKMARELDRAALAASMTRSEFVRDILRRRQLAFAQLRELQQETARRARQAGIRTSDDVVRAVREIRDRR